LAEFTVSCRICGVIAKTVLAAKFLCDLIEDPSKGVLIVQYESSATGFRRKFSQCGDISASEPAA
jgi:hypothetical protein